MNFKKFVGDLACTKFNFFTQLANSSEKQKGLTLFTSQISVSREAYIFLLYFCNYLLEFQLFRRPEFGWQVLPDIGLDLLLEVEGYIVSFVLYMRIALYICYLP